jgi:hypothetical protein
MRPPILIPVPTLRRAGLLTHGAMLALMLAVAPGPAWAQSEDASTIAELRRQLNEMQRRLEQLEARTAKPPAVAAVSSPGRRLTAPVSRTANPAPAAASTASVQSEVDAARAAAAEARAAAAEAQAAQRGMAEARAAETAPVKGLLPPEPMGEPFEDALRSDLPGLAFRVPGTQSQVRFYGFAKTSMWQDINARNQTGAPLPGQIPMVGSAAWQQGGDFGMTAQFSRFGIDSRTLTDWGTLETRLEGDFAGGSGTNLLFRLRQAWGELGSERFRVLAGQANSLWNEGLFETLIDATNLNQSFIRQAQLRVTGQLASNLTGQFSLEAPETQYTSAAGVFTPNTRLDGGASPAFDTMPDFLGRLNYSKDGLELVGRGIVRRLSLRTTGTAAEPPAVTRNASGWGFAGHVNFPMRWLADSFGPDQLIVMGFYGQGIGRYFLGSTINLDAVSNIGLPNVASGQVSFDPVTTYGALAAYRRFWATQVRSNFSFAYTYNEFPAYTLGFTPGSSSALALNRDLYQVFANLIWSPFATVLPSGTVGNGWMDVGLEYLLTRRDLFGGAAQSGTGVSGYGIANRFLFAATARF